MPEGPEIRTAANFINKVCETTTFSGPVIRGELAIKLPLVNFNADSYTLRAEARGKELKIHLCDLNPKPDTIKTNEEDGEVKTLLFHFGMSGCFQFTTVSEIPKHAHLQFHTADRENVLSFVDYRRFGSWKINGDWGPDRGPDPVTQYQEFRENILSNLDDSAFNRAICEVMLNQKFFNGIGNYLRAEILFRLRIPPFEVARKVLEPIKDQEGSGVKKEGQDLLDLCHSLPLEVLGLGYGKGYDVEHVEGDYSVFTSWLQCYNKDGMSNLADKNGRTIWFTGPTGSLKPPNAKSRARVIYKGKKKKEEAADVKLVKKSAAKPKPDKKSASKEKPVNNASSKQVAKKSGPVKKVAKKSVSVKTEVAKKFASNSRQKAKLEIKTELVENDSIFRENGQTSSTLKNRLNSKDLNRPELKLEQKSEIAKQKSQWGTRRKSRDQSVEVESKKMKKVENLNKNPAPTKASKKNSSTEKKPDSETRKSSRIIKREHVLV